MRSWAIRIKLIWFLINRLCFLLELITCYKRNHVLIRSDVLHCKQENFQISNEYSRLIVIRWELIPNALHLSGCLLVFLMTLRTNELQVLKNLNSFKIRNCLREIASTWIFSECHTRNCILEFLIKFRSNRLLLFFLLVSRRWCGYTLCGSFRHLSLSKLTFLFNLNNIVHSFIQ